MKTSILKKLLTFTLPITMIPIIVVMVFYYMYLNKVLENDTIDLHKNILTHIIHDVRNKIDDPLKLDAHLNHEHIGLPKIAIYDKEMNVMAHNFDMRHGEQADHTYDKADLRLNFEEIRQSKDNDVIHDEMNMLLITSMMENGKIVAYITSGYKSTVDEKMVAINQTFLYLFFVIIFTVFIIAIFVIIFSLKLLHPLELLIDGIKKITAGDLSFTIKNVSDDEIAIVVDAFNDMTLKRKLIEDELRDSATRDGLTGLYNHKHFYTLLENEIPRDERYHHHLSLLLLDVDHFKNVNDTYGHRAGDSILRDLSKRLLDRARSTDSVCRYGGEEMTLLLPETDSTAASQIAEDLRILIEQEPFEIEEGQDVNVTVSIGIASYPEHAQTVSTLVSSADTALYEAKKGGRNRVCIYVPQTLSDAEAKR